MDVHLCHDTNLDSMLEMLLVGSDVGKPVLREINYRQPSSTQQSNNRGNRHCEIGNGCQQKNFLPEIVSQKSRSYLEETKRSLSKSTMSRIDGKFFATGDERLLKVCDGMLCS